jgi:hypothetical protein
MEAHAQKSSSSQSISPFTLKKLRYGGYELVLRRDGRNQHICDFRSEDEANSWIRENCATYGGAGSEI